MKVLGYYWKGWDHALSDFLYHVFGLWTHGRVLDEITDAIHPDFGWAIRDAYEDCELRVEDAFARGYEAGLADRELKSLADDDPEETLP